MRPWPSPKQAKGVGSVGVPAHGIGDVYGGNGGVDGCDSRLEHLLSIVA